jgi:hypothetical protein
MTKLTFAAIAATLLVTGCASITQGTSQAIAFNIEPDTTTCVVTREGDGEIGSLSPRNSTLSVSKDKDDILVKCNAPGYRQKVTRLTSSTQAAGVIGGAFLDLGIVDMMTGAMWKYPSDVSITLERTEATVAAPANEVHKEASISQQN